MIRNVRARAVVALCAIASLAAVNSADAASHLRRSSAKFEEEKPVLRGGGFSFTMEPASPTTAMDNDLTDFLGPYFYFLVTNTGESDTYDMLLNGLDDPINWWPQVCVGSICIPGDSSAHAIAAASADTLGLNVVANTDGVDTMTFTVRSQGNPALSTTYEVTLYAGTAAVAVQEVGTLGAGWELRQNQPNPVRTATSIGFALPRPGAIDLRVYDVSGRIVRTLSRDAWPAGSHALHWDARNDTGAPVPAGVYFYRLVTEEGTLSRRLTVLR